MITEEKIKAARKELRNGIPEGELRERLTTEGYAKEDIDKVFTPHKYNMKSWYLGFGIVFLLTGIAEFLRSGGLILLLFAAFMFFQYHRETGRLKKEGEEKSGS